MTPNRRIFRVPNQPPVASVLSGLAGLFLFASAWAQPTPPVAPAPAPSESEEAPLELSPFVVSTALDTGYQAQSTLAGSRLSTPLKDIGAAVSVYTKDFMADIGATNANDLLIFATGMEAGGAGGNFSGTNASISETQVVGDGPRTNPQSGSRSRGLSSPSFTRNYFLSNIAVDGYNTASVTVNRGPNSILFGMGSPSGVVENSLITANLNKARTTVEHRFGDNQASRFVLDTNQVLVPKKLAIRIAALDDREKYDQRPSYEDKSRLFGTGIYKPFASTTLSVNFETGNTRANRPITVLPFDSISKYWYAAGRPTYNWAFYDNPTLNPLAATTDSGGAATVAVRNAMGIGSAQLFGGLIIPYESASTPGSGPSPGVRSQIASTGSTTNPTANAVRNSLFHPQLNRDSASDAIAFYETFNIGESGISAALFPGGIRPAGMKMQSFTDYSVFPFNKRQIDETSIQKDDFRTFSISLSQTAWKDKSGVDKVGVELVYNSETFERYANNAFFSQGNGNHIRIDPNVTLPDGRPNPNVGRPYVMGASAAQLNFFESERTNARLTAFLRHDFKDNFEGSLAKILGRHTLTGLYQDDQFHDLSSSTRLRLFGEAAEAIGAVTNFNRLPNAIVYLGDSITNGGALQLQPIRIKQLAGGQVFDTTWFQAPLGLVNGQLTQGSLVTTRTNLEESINDARARGERIKSEAFVLQSYLLADHLITTVGWRKDRDYLRVFPARSYTTDPTRARMFLTDYNFEKTPPLNTQGQTRSFSAVIRWPQRLLRLPRGTDASIFISESQNFTPDAGRISAENDPIPAPKGKTDEFGLSLSLFNDKLNLRVNQFETSQENASRGSTYGNAVNNFYRQLASFWNQQSNATPQFDRINDINELLNTLPGTKALLNWQRVINPTTGVYSSTENVLPTFSDTQDFVSKGTELEVVYNPTRQWRIAFNLAKQETVVSNLAPYAKATIAKLLPIWEKYKDTPRAASTTWGGPGVPFPASNGEHLGTLVQRDVLVPYATLLAQEGVASSEQRKWRANLVTNFQFRRDSRLKGFNVGSGVRWQDKFALGYPTTFRPDGSVFVDIAKPFWSDDDLNIDAWVGYTRKVYRDKINWRVQLNVRNIVGTGDPIAITVQPDGSPAAMRLPPEKRIYLTNTFEF
jgi:hypothetical protein